MSTHRFVPVAEPVIGARELEAVTDAVRSGWVSSIGEYLDRFERGFADFSGAKHGVAVMNGTVALRLAFAALGIGPGAEVIVPDLTFAATAHTVLEAGATPVLVDVDPETWCLDPRAVERALTARTRAVVPVHLYGHPADVPALIELSRPRGIHVIEDAAEAHGAEIGGRTVGAIGTVGAFSFYGNKIMTTGEGGMLLTNDDALAQRLRFLKDHGMSKERRYFHSELAFNFRMTNLQAALGVAQLEQLEGFIAKKRSIMGQYREQLGPRDDLTLNPERAGCRSVFWMASAVLGARVPMTRDEVCRRLRERGVDTRPFFACMSELPHLAGARQVGVDGDACPVSRELSMRGINLPSGCTLTDDDVTFVADTLASVLEQA